MDGSWFLLLGLALVTCFSEVQGISYAGCFTLPTGISVATDVLKLGWSDKWEVNDLNIQFCVNHCLHKSIKYAGVVKATGAKTYCVCGSERAYQRLGTADHKISKRACSHNIWAMNVYVAYGDVSLQYVGCYKDGTGKDAFAANKWIDKWSMSPIRCISYCEANGRAFASVKNGDFCTCESGYSRFGKASETECNMVCSGSLGEKCGGAQANSVYSTISIGEILRPATSVITHGFHTSDVPAVPITDSLMAALYAFQEAVSQQVPSPSVRSIGNFISRAASLTQKIIDLKMPLANMATSSGFALSNSAFTKQWLSSPFPLELQPFADVIKQSHSFINVYVQKVEDYVASVSVNSKDWITASRATLQVLKGYVDNGLDFRGISESIKAAQQMVSASRFCVPQLSKKKSMMASNLETVSNSLINGPHGTKKFTQLLKSPVSITSVSITALPATSATWEATLTEISNGWAKFVMQNGGKLIGLISTHYAVTCPTNDPNSVVGKRAACKEESGLDFFDLVQRPGENEAKRDMQKFIADNTAVFNAFKWTSYEKKLAGILTDFQAINKAIADSGLGTPAMLEQLQDEFKSRQLYQSCARQLSEMINAACYRTSTPDESKVSTLTC